MKTTTDESNCITNESHNHTEERTGEKVTNVTGSQDLSNFGKVF